MLQKLIGDKHVDYYNAHGTATNLNDEAEAAMINNLFGTRKHSRPSVHQVPHRSHAGRQRHYRSDVCAESIQHNKVHGNTCKTVYDDLNITAETRDVHVDTAVSASFGFGGQNAAIMMERYK